MSFKKNFAQTGLTHAIVFVFGFAMSILNARFLGPEGVGILVLLELLKAFSINISDLGFGRSLRYYSANGEIHFLILKKIIVQVGILLGFIVVLISLLLKNLPLDVWNEIDNLLYLAYLPTIFCLVLVNYYRHLLHGQLQITAVNISQILERVFYIILFLAFVWLFDLGLFGAVISLTISTFLLLLMLFLKARKYSLEFERSHSQNLKKSLKLIWGYGKWTYFSTFINYFVEKLPVFLLKSFGSTFAVIGYFSKAQGLANYPRIAAVPFSGLLFSYNAGSNIDSAITRTDTMCRLTFWAINILFITLGLFIKPIITILYGKEFLPAAEFFFYLYPSVIFYIQTLYLTSFLGARGLNKKNFMVKMRSFPFIVVLIYFLIKYLGGIGTAISISATFAILWFQYAIVYFKLSNSSFKRVLLLYKSDIALIYSLLLKLKSKLKTRN